MHGGNGRDNYVDVEAARVVELAGIGQLLKEAWARIRLKHGSYRGTPEVHKGRTDEVDQ